MPRMLHELVALLVLSCYLLACHAQSPAPFKRTEGYRINARVFNATITRNSLYGGLELSRDGINWGYVCDNYLTTDVAKVICRMFNYSYGEGIAGGRLGQSSGQIFPNRFTCNARHKNLTACAIGAVYGNCTHSTGIMCFNNTKEVVELRVVDGDKRPYQISGRLEVRLNSVLDWGSVCDDGFSSLAAMSACNYIGYKYGEYADAGVFGSSNVTYLDEVDCEVGQMFPYCDHSIWGQHDCRRSEDVGVICMNSSVKLISAVKTDFHVGTVEVYLANETGWFEVCDAGWDDLDAKVACKEFGFSDGRALSRSALGLESYGSLTAAGSVTNISCSGNEPDLTSCSMQKTYTCGFNESVINLAAVICYDHPVSEADLIDNARIVSDSGSSSDVGFLEIRHMGVWGRVCEDTSFTETPVSDKEASVACRMMGYIGGKRLGRVNVIDEKYHVWLRGISCTGTENSIAECKIPAWGLPGQLSCMAPVRIACYHQEITLNLRHESSRTGFLYITHDDKELDICADNWKDSEANTACQQLGFLGGITWSKENNTSTGTSTVVGGVDCTSADGKFYHCIKKQWGIPKTQCNKGPAGISCFNNVKIDPQNDGAGILQIYNNVSKLWSPICRKGFDDIDATVACKELGYTQGTNLPSQVFGFYFFWPQHSNVNCNGSEKSILDCSYSTNIENCTSSDYVSVSCFNTTLNGTIKLENGYSDTSEASGVLRIYQNSTWGYACDDFFTSTDALAFCSKVGQAMGHQYAYGVRSKSLSNVPGPFFATFPNCTKNENAQYVCNPSNVQCMERRAVSLICAENSAPELQMVDDENGIHSGRLQISINRNAGAICANRWTDEEATVACKQLNPEYITGIAKLYNRSTSSFVLSGIKCYGFESNLFQCNNDGWRKINSTVCGSTTMEAGAICFKRVVFKDQIVTRNSISGRLGLVVNRLIKDVCFDYYFTFLQAQMACQELGYINAAILKPADSDPANRYSMIKRFNCKGDESSLLHCTYSTGSCSFGQVRLLCYRTDVNDIRDWIIHGNNNIGQLRINMFDQYTGLVCPINFLDKDANITCSTRQKFGVALGSPPLLGSEKEIVWFGKINCTTSTNGFSNCVFDKTVSTECFTKNYSAGVLCFSRQDDFGMRLMDNERERKTTGRVEIKINGQWGSVCDKSGDNLQARAFCLQKGFMDGSTISSSPKRYGNATGQILLKNVMCTRSNTLFLGCPNDGFGEVSNCTHQDDLEVVCYSKERFYPNPESHFGAVSVDSSGDYKLVCSENFTDREATVLCRSMGYQAGKSICCSALKIPPLSIGMSRTSCIGYEKSLLECSHITSGGIYTCPSQQFASAACSYEADNDYRLTVEHMDKGRLVITYYNVRGTVCADDFDQRDAQVACREAGFITGLAFKAPYLPNSFPVTWVSHLQCQGSESSLDHCANFSLDHSSYCNYVASVICLRQNDDKEIRVRLSNGTNQNTGRLEVQINGTWGSVCHEQIQDITEKEADVICKELGFRSGQLLAPGSFGPSSGPVWLHSVNCSGSEARIQECQLERAGGEQPNCLTHMYDLAVECFVNVKLINGPTDGSVRGQLQAYVKESELWHYVCDSGITDREATLVCRSLNYQFGKQQCCSAAGPLYSNVNFVTSVNCPESATDITNCTFRTDGTCSSGHYAYVHCSHTAFTNESLLVNGMATFIGQPTVKRFGIDGYICNDGFSNYEAHVMCVEMGFHSGQLLHPAPLPFGSVIILQGLNCYRSERIKDCSYSNLSNAGMCNNMQTARIMCLNSNSPITFSVKEDANFSSGLAKIQIDGRYMVIEDNEMDDLAASVFCRSISDKKYVYGNMYPRSVTSRDQGAEVLMTNIHCTGNETNVLQCNADFLPQYAETRNLAYIECFTGAELEQNPRGTKSAGILILYNKNQQMSGAVCSTNFGEKEADVACRMLGHEHGITHCCLPFGYNYQSIKFKNFKCSGNELSLFDCHYESLPRYSSTNACTSGQDYVALTCYNGTKPNNFSISFVDSSPSSNSGILQLTYLNTPGTVCNQGWDDKDAKVACREMNFANGIAYSHYKPTFSLTESSGTFWISNVQCNGSESKLADCPHSGLGNVRACDKGHYAGVLCMQGSEVVFRLVGSDKPHYGRVEVNINGVWGTLCDRMFDARDAAVMCRNIGYVTGDVLNTQDLVPGQGPVWQIAPRCTGNENNINDCPHEGWITDESSSCSTHARDAGVFCYTSVRLGTGSGKSFSHGPVNIYENGFWYKVCANGFSDTSARLVCQELGYYDGRALCCSAYSGESVSQEDVHPNITVQCAGDEHSVQQCIKVEQCQSSAYASVVCFEAESNINETDYLFTMNKDFETAGRIEVTHMNVKGRICSNNWNDVDARVFCRAMNYSDGLAYYHSYDDTYVSASFLGPYWVSNISCVGTEESLSQCKFNDRHNLGNCSGAHTAGAVCFNDTGIQYRLNGSSHNNSGRIEMALDNTWGTICGDTWDTRDARVACKSLGYTDGEAEADNKYGGGSGPVWLRNIQCTGTESFLHMCPHTGFQNEVPEPDSFLFPWTRVTCSNHFSDATVFCFKEAKLNQKLDMSTGALLYSHNNKWVHLCDSDTFTRNEAKVACKSLLKDYIDGVPVRGQVFGQSDAPIEISSIRCTGNENTLSQCYMSTSSCTSNAYVSVACFNYTLSSQDLNFKVTLSEDSIKTGDDHGIIQIRQNGAWGRICLRGFTDKEATVACKELGGFAGGVVYLHLFKNRLPMLWTSTKCSGNESSLQNCNYSTNVDLQHCSYNSNDAGVLCYKGEGVHYRLEGGANASTGRVEIGIDGKYKSICSMNWNAANSKVLCRHLGYLDGIPSDVKNNSLQYLSPLMSFFACEGNESSLLTCINSGFDGGRNSFHCGGDAYTSCFHEEIKITNIRLVGGEKNHGRVELFVTGLNEWGTLCDDLWDKPDAQVVCRYLGFQDGEVVTNTYNEGQGHIFLDNIECNGTESSLSECKHPGIGFHNCDHSEDAAVRCYDGITSSPATTVRTTMTTSNNFTKFTGTLTSTTIASTTASTSSSTPGSSFKPSSPDLTTLVTTMTTQLNEHNFHAQTKDTNTNVIVAACVTILVALVLIAVVIFLVVRYRSKQKSIPHTRFHDDDVVHSNDGSVAVSNRMFDISNPDGEDPMVEGSEVHLDRKGYVTFSKGSPNSELQPSTQDGFDNPLYAVMRDPRDVGNESTT